MIVIVLVLLAVIVCGIIVVADSFITAVDCLSVLIESLFIVVLYDDGIGYDLDLCIHDC